MYGETSIVNISNGSTEEFKWQIYYKIDFPIGHYFHVTNANADIGRLKSLLTLLISVWTTWWLNVNKIVWSELYQILCFLTTTTKKKKIDNF